MTFLSNFRVKGILCSFSLVLEQKEDKEIPESSRLEILEKISKKHCLIRCRRQHIRLIKWRRYIRLFVQSDRFFCFININKFDSFKKSFSTIASLNFLFPFPLILLIQIKEVISMSCSSNTGN